MAVMSSYPTRLPGPSTYQSTGLPFFGLLRFVFKDARSSTPDRCSGDLVPLECGLVDAVERVDSLIRANGFKNEDIPELFV